MVNSLYYDTNSYYFARQNLDGISKRYKVRIRYYDDVSALNKPILEIKSRIGNVGTKYRIELDKDQLINNSFSLSYINENRNIPIELMDYLPLIEPKLIVNYHRKYYIEFGY